MSNVSQLLIYHAHQYGGQYIGYGSDPPAPSKETIMPNMERLLIASSPIQELVMTSRHIYRWEQPAETLTYLLIYATLWYLDMLLPGSVSNASRSMSCNVLIVIARSMYVCGLPKAQPWQHFRRVARRDQASRRSTPYCFDFHRVDRQRRRQELV